MKDIDYKSRNPFSFLMCNKYDIADNVTVLFLRT